MLSLKEIATLLALIKGPDYYHPVRHLLRLLKRKQSQAIDFIYLP
ncbi:hypothetical protein HUE58_03250 [Candidatus Ruthia endofausta]|uniref:Uncharacterized protein n=1 Tax=Candidatus Ruthia endofausta TaxID=2738852 RepID=A0A6N0HPF9_9GAMM|nr:hypothetical protein HUE58_03250 [Candidatus Ruthia endofausta]